MPVEVLAFALPLKTRQEIPQEPGCVVALNFRHCLVEFKRIDITVRVHRHQTAFVQMRQDFPHAFRQRRQDRVTGIIRFQISQNVRLGTARKREEKHGVLQCEVLG